MGMTVNENLDVGNALNSLYRTNPQVNTLSWWIRCWPVNRNIASSSLKPGMVATTLSQSVSPGAPWLVGWLFIWNNNNNNTVIVLQLRSTGTSRVITV